MIVKEKESPVLLDSSQDNVTSVEKQSLNMIWLARQRSIIIFVILQCHYEYQMSWKILMLPFFFKNCMNRLNRRKYILLLTTIKTKWLKWDRNISLSRWNMFSFVLYTPTLRQYVARWNLLRKYPPTQDEKKKKKFNQ